MISIQHHTTVRAYMRADTQAFLDERTALTTLLARVVWRNFDHWNGVYGSIGLHPGEEQAPRSIVNRLGKVRVAHHIGYL